MPNPITRSGRWSALMRPRPSCCHPAAAAASAGTSTAAGLRVPAGGHPQPVPGLRAVAGWRHVAVTQRRTMQDFAQQMRWLVDEAYPEVPVVRVVLDNPVSSTGQALNTHRTASLYETFPAAEARRIAKRLEFHYTPKHGSWLNMAEMSSAYWSAPV